MNNILVDRTRSRNECVIKYLWLKTSRFFVFSYIIKLKMNNILDRSKSVKLGNRGM